MQSLICWYPIIITYYLHVVTDDVLPFFHTYTNLLIFHNVHAWNDIIHFPCISYKVFRRNVSIETHFYILTFVVSHPYNLSKFPY